MAAFRGGTSIFPVTTPTVVDAEGAGLSSKPPDAIIWRRHATRSGHDHHTALTGGIAMIDDGFSSQVHQKPLIAYNSFSYDKFTR